MKNISPLLLAICLSVSLVSPTIAFESGDEADELKRVQPSTGVLGASDRYGGRQKKRGWFS